MRVGYILAGLFLAGNAVYIAIRLADGPLLTLVAVAPALLAALALGALLIVKNVRRKPEEPEAAEHDTTEKRDHPEE